jgi:hypothetical protein
MDAGKQNGDEFPRHYVTPPEVWCGVIVLEVETDVDLSPLRILAKNIK